MDEPPVKMSEISFEFQSKNNMDEDGDKECLPAELVSSIKALGSIT